MKHTGSWLLTTVWMMPVGLSGCNSADERLVELSEQNAARQAEQNHEIARQSQAVAEATRRLVEADSQARTDMIRAQQTLQQSMQQERTVLHRQHEILEQERRSLAAARQRDPVIANAITASAALLGCLLPLFVCVYVLRVLGRPESDHELNELLVCELSDEDSLLIPGPTQHGPAAIAAPATALLSAAGETHGS